MTGSTVDLEVGSVGRPVSRPTSPCSVDGNVVWTTVEQPVLSLHTGVDRCSLRPVTRVYF